jgi:hypothetical protein
MGGQTVRHIMCLHDWGPSDASKWMVGDGELSDPPEAALDHDGSSLSNVEMTTAED